MRPEQTAAVYDQLAGHWAGDAVNPANGIAQHERALRFLPRRGAAIDVGCGSNLRIIDWLLRQGFQAEGLDISAGMLAWARKKRPEVAFVHADICTWEFPRRYDFISAWDSIWHIPLVEHRPVLAKICAALNPGGVFLFTTGGVDKPDERTNPCASQPQHSLYHSAPGLPEIIRTLDASGCACRHLEYDQQPQPEGHVFIIAQKN